MVAVLAEIDTARLDGFDRVEVVKAQYRQLNHDTARLMTAMVDVGLCGEAPDGVLPPRLARPDEFAADEFRAALSWSRRSAERRFATAYDLLSRLPEVHAALYAGEIDESKARGVLRVDKRVDRRAGRRTVRRAAARCGPDDLRSADREDQAMGDRC